MKEAQLERYLKALANRRRLAILHMLLKRKEASVGTIADAIKLSLTSTSKHLLILERAGFTDKEQKSLNVYYRIVSDAPAILSHVLKLLSNSRE
ncbi:MAG TPA: metalloregulator ArsR/SmtB family transcription factor [Candidatus Paceibacterota bacterium]|nr:metalloregulator ArsR/SmtB family transcription factor [Candidatus Paceibacterota bacterium]